MSTPTYTTQTPAPAVPPAAPAAPPAPAPASPPAAPAPEASDKGFPEHTRVEDMTAPQQAAYWREQSKTQQRKYEQLGVTAEQLAEMRGKVEQFEALTAASQTDQQRAVAEAEARVRAEVAGQYAARLVDASITAAVAGRVPADALAQQLAPVDRRWFLTEAGDVDLDKVTAYATQLAGAAPLPPTAPPNHGAGYRPGAAPVGADAGREMARRRFGEPQQ